MKLLNRFWAWYERNYVLNSGIVAGLFLLQLVHLYWLTTHVVMFKLTGHSYFNPNGFWQTIIILVDYTEIPALISTSVLYLYELHKGFTFKAVLFLILLNSQWLHLFWITDEFVLDEFVHTHSDVTMLPGWLAWVAIFIDYLELPVIYDTLKNFFSSLVRKK